MRKYGSLGLTLALCVSCSHVAPAADSASTSSTTPLRAENSAPATLAGRDFLTILGKEWKLLWHDEFSGPQLDKTKWSIGLPWGGTDGTGRHHNENYASYIMDDDISVRGGRLHLTTQRRDVTDSKGRVFHFTEGLITTNKTFRATHGYFEIFAKMPTEAGPGTWPAFWTLADGWPPEFDIIEYWGSDNRIHQGTATRKPEGGERWDSYHRSQASLSGWHTYGLEWGPGYQVYNIDGKVTYTVYGAHLLPDRAHYLLLNSGVDARRPPRPHTTFPNDFIVEYVRVYARPDVPALLNGGFENEALAPWSRSNEAAIVDYESRSGKRCLRLDSGGTEGDKAASSAQQTVYGLKPNARYRLTGYATTSGGAMAHLGVREHGGEQTVTPLGVTKSASYRPLVLSFTTGPQATSATVFCRVDGDGSAFFDDIHLERISP
ncbi:MAG TPA: family 16 glycosylhydrolase [Abditibacteriaceae bacterium]|jgi:beta-glucanase (GH16 family)